MGVLVRIEVNPKRTVYVIIEIKGGGKRSRNPRQFVFQRRTYFQYNTPFSFDVKQSGRGDVDNEMSYVWDSISG